MPNNVYYMCGIIKRRNKKELIFIGTYYELVLSYSEYYLIITKHTDKNKEDQYCDLHFTDKLQLEDFKYISQNYNVKMLKPSF